MSLVEVTDRGLYCARGDFYIDPWKPVNRAVVTHAHADHARPGSGRYWAARSGVPLLELRLGRGGREPDLRPVDWGERVELGPVAVSFHPAGHVLGSAQVRLEAAGEPVWVISGDYKRAADPTAESLEVVPSDVFVTEATFALPVYRWQSPEKLSNEVLDWWWAHRDDGRASVLFCYSLGKAQRLMAELRRRLEERGETADDHPVWTHGAVEAVTSVYRHLKVPMLPTRPVSEAARGHDFSGSLVLAPPGASGSPWMRRFGRAATGFASGWMRLRGTRRRRGYEAGFVLSDHADWPGLVDTVLATGARQVFATHGYSDTFARYLRQEHGLDAAPLRTLFSGEGGSDEVEGDDGAETVE